MQEETKSKKKSSILMASILGLIALGFYFAGIYLANQ